MLLDHQWAAYTIPHDVPLGTYLFKEGDPADALYLITEGQVAIIKGVDGGAPLVLGYRGENEMVGEIGLLYEETRTASALAVVPTRLLAISASNFWTLFDGQPDFRRIVLRHIIEDLLRADQSRMLAASAENRVLERLQSLATENERLAEIVQLRRETLNFIVHDLRNPLNLILMALEMIQVDPAYRQNAESRQFLELALGGVQRMYALVESLLDIERLEENDPVLDIAPADLPGLIETVLRQQQPLASATRISLTSRIVEPGPPPVPVDAERIRRVLTNLIDNALRFTPPGQAIRVETWQAGREALIAVEDQGPGIPPEQRSRVFDRFAQIDARKRSSRGFGLGLAYCRSAVEAHGGRIWVEDGAEGRGARFVLALPLVPPGVFSEEG